MKHRRKKTCGRRRPALLLAVMMTILLLWTPLLQVEAAETAPETAGETGEIPEDLTETGEEAVPETEGSQEAAGPGDPAEAAAPEETAVPEGTAEPEKPAEREITAAPDGSAQPEAEEAPEGPAEQEAETEAEPDAEEAAGPQEGAGTADPSGDVPEVTIDGSANTDGIYNFGPYNIMSSSFKYWTTPLYVTDSYGNTAKAYCGAALMDGSKSDGSFRNVWKTRDPMVIKCAYYSIGDGAALAQKIFQEGNADGKGSGDPVRGGEILGHFAMSLLIQDLYPDNVPPEFRVDLQKWQTSGYRLGSAGAHGTTRMNKWFARAITDYLDAVRSRPVPSGTDVYLCQNNANRQQIYYYLVKVPAGILRIRKVSADPAHTEGNARYSLEGAEYGIYRSREAAEGRLKEGLAVTLTTDAQGMSGTAELEAGVYYAVEQTAPKGFVLDRTVREIRITAGEENTVTFQDQPRPAPEVRTQLRGEDGTQEVRAASKVVLTDLVTFRHLEEYVGQEVTFRGTLVDRDSGEEIASSEILRKLETADGAEEVPFAIDASSLAGKTAVAFQEIRDSSGEVIVSRRDPEDPEETVTFPKIATTAHAGGAEEGRDRKCLPAGPEAVLTDIVRYENLVPGRTYTVRGSLYDKGKGAPAAADGREITAEAAFTPGQPDGEVTVTFTFDASGFAGSDLVAFEELAAGGRIVAEHREPDDEAQTVHVPSVATTATDAADGDHVLAPEGQVTVTDHVEYRNLETGRAYRVDGTLVNSRGDAVLLEGSPLTASLEFVPEAPDGAVDLEITFPAEEIGTGTYVLFERLYETGGAAGRDFLTAVHEDPDDAAQTVEIPEKPGEPEEPERPRKPSPPRKGSPRTGDAAPLLPLAAGCAVSAAGLAILLTVSRRHNARRGIRSRK